MTWLGLRHPGRVANLDRLGASTAAWCTRMIRWPWVIAFSRRESVRGSAQRDAAAVDFTARASASWSASWRLFIGTLVVTTLATFLAVQNSGGDGASATSIDCSGRCSVWRAC